MSTIKLFSLLAEIAAFIMIDQEGPKHILDRRVEWNEKFNGHTINVCASTTHNTGWATCDYHKKEEKIEVIEKGQKKLKKVSVHHPGKELLRAASGAQPKIVIYHEGLVKLDLDEQEIQEFLRFFESYFEDVNPELVFRKTIRPTPEMIIKEFEEMGLDPMQYRVSHAEALEIAGNSLAFMRPW